MCYSIVSLTYATCNLVVSLQVMNMIVCVYKARLSKMCKRRRDHLDFLVMLNKYYLPVPDDILLFVARW